MTPRRIVLLVLLIALGALFVQPVRSYRDSEDGLVQARADLCAPRPSRTA